tara:strand:- start:67 stop:678 length:612 start_codon:yes stop_codon:yes gene_type:complete
MNVNDRNYWNNKYTSNEFKWDLGYPTPIFKDWSNKNKSCLNKKICIPGCGRGHDAIHLARIGFDVYAFDFSIEAIKYLKKKSKEEKVNINLFCEDFFLIHEKFNDYFDYILEYTFYCAINPDRRGEYINKCYNILKNKGKIIAVMLPINTDLKDGPPFKVLREELTENFNPKFNILKMTKSPLSIKARSNIELYVEYEKKESI